MNDIIQLRDHLFATIDALRDKDNPLDIERARAISDVAQTIINSAKAEVDYMRATGQTIGTGFMPELEGPKSGGKSDRHQTATGTLTRIGNTTVHRMR